MPRKTTDAKDLTGSQYDSDDGLSFSFALVGALGVCAIVAVIRPAHADPRAVVELFTSQGCSSCPPADKIIGELAKDPSSSR